MEVTNTMLKNFRKDFSAAVAELESKYNLKIDQGSIKYDSSSFSMKLTVNSKDEVALEKKAKNLDNFARLYGIQFKDSFTETRYIMNGKTFRVTDIKPCNHKYPFIAICLSDGKNYKLSVEQLKSAVLT